MAGDQQRLKDAQIEVKVDTSAAERAIDDLEPGGGSRPGRRPPEPGRERDERERPKPDKGRGPAGTAAAAASIPRGVIRLVKTFAAAVVLQEVARVVPSMIEKRIAQMAPGVMRDVTDAVLGNIGRFLTGIVDTGENITANIGAITTGISTARDVARAQQLLLPPKQRDPADIAALALRQAQLSQIDSAFAMRRRRIGAAALGGAILDVTDTLRERYLGAIYR